MRFWILVLILVIIILTIYLLIILYKDQLKSGDEIFNPHLYESRFRESRFITSDKKYDEIVEKGYEIMKTKKISIIGLAYNIEAKVPKLLRRLKHLRSGFDDCHVVIYCFDSSDDTYTLLNENKPDWLTLPTDILENKKNLTRLPRMANLRNICLNYIRPDDDYAIILDYDLAGPVSMDGIANSFYHLSKDFDVLCGNGMVNLTGLNIYENILGYQYYDPFAVETLDNRSRFDISVHSFKMKRGDAPFEVKSGFGGIAIYQAELLRKYKYIPDEKICEHTTLHKQIFDNGYKIGINPSLMLLSGIQGGS